MRRYAIYYAPRPDEPLAAFARAWLGRDPETDAECIRIEVAAIAPDRLLAVTADPTHYGFHGTLKPPFVLVDGSSEADFLSDVSRFAAGQKPLRIERIMLEKIGGFLALVPQHMSHSLNALAAECVRSFDRYRSPPSAAELQRRRAAGLSQRQDELLLQWGYPYVMDEFRFHLTLTGSLDQPERDAVHAVLEELTADLCRSPLMVRDIAVFVQDDGQAPFRILARFPLGGS